MGSGSLVDRFERGDSQGVSLLSICLASRWHEDVPGSSSPILLERDEETRRCGPRIFRSCARPHSMGETRFFVVLLENHFKKTVWSRHLFLFYFKGEKQNKKEKP